jgi:uncharacterized protein (TIGR02466 family)
MEHKFYDIFPTPVIKFKFNREFTQEEINFFDKNKNIVYKNFGNSYSSNSEILDCPEMESIKIFCEDSLNFYFEKIYNPQYNVNPYITQSWLNWTYKGEYHHTHNHPNSLISGVFYIKADKKKDSITFTKPDYKQIDIFPRSLNDYNSSEVDFVVESYELLLFPSSLYHRVNALQDGERISLAFNSFVKGELGTLKTLSYLKV